MLFWKKKKTVKEYDREHYVPVLRASICTGETTAGFRHKENGTFLEDRLILSSSDLQEFKEDYGITEELETIY